MPCSISTFACFSMLFTPYLCCQIENVFICGFVSIYSISCQSGEDIFFNCLSFLIGIVKHFGKYAYLLSCRALKEKINATLMSVW